MEKYIKPALEVLNVELEDTVLVTLSTGAPTVASDFLDEEADFD